MEAKIITREALRNGGEYIIRANGRGNKTLAIRIALDTPIHYGEVDGVLCAVVFAYRIQRTGDREQIGNRNIYTRRVSDFTEF